jgi:hypothetical protein
MCNEQSISAKSLAHCIHIFVQLATLKTELQGSKVATGGKQLALSLFGQTVHFVAGIEYSGQQCFQLLFRTRLFLRQLAHY